MKKTFLFLILLFFFKFSFATHNQGGRIEVDQISIQTFKITIYTYTKTSSSSADRPSLDSVHLGDGSIQTFMRNSFTDLAYNVRLNIYIDVHTYPASGFYKVHFTDPNRNIDIINIPNSVIVPFHLETEFYADPIHCPYNSAHLLSLPIFTYPMHKDFNLSRAAFDPNWDSLSYEIDTCLTVGGAPVAGYSIPAGVNVNPISGEFSWIGDSMNTMGEYNFAIKTIKWRNGNYYGFVLEDFQVILYATTDNVFDFNTSLYPPNFTSTILPGNQFNLSVEYNNDTTFTPVQFYSEIANQSSFISSTGVFTWTPTTADIRDTPYILQFRGKKDLTYLIYVDGISYDTCRSLIGLEDINLNENNITLFPNPASTQLHIDVDNYKNQRINASLFDMTGKIVFQKYLNDEGLINVSSLAQGLYFIKLQVENKVFYKKVLLN